MLHDIADAGLAGLVGAGAVAAEAAAAQTISGFGMNLILAPAAQLLLAGAYLRDRVPAALIRAAVLVIAVIGAGLALAHALP